MPRHSNFYICELTGHVGQVAKPTGRSLIGPNRKRNFRAVHYIRIVTAVHRRRLPHYHAIGQPTFLTWRFHGSLPIRKATECWVEPGNHSGKTKATIGLFAMMPNSGRLHITIEMNPVNAGLIAAPDEFL